MPGLTDKDQEEVKELIHELIRLDQHGGPDFHGIRQTSSAGSPKLRRNCGSGGEEASLQCCHQSRAESQDVLR